MTERDVFSPGWLVGTDNIAPSSTVQSIYKLDDGRHIVNWRGSDWASHVASYNIDYKPEGGATWSRWLANTTGKSGVFVPPDGRVYWFRSQATDNAGNVEPLHAVGDINTNSTTRLHVQALFPIIHSR